MAPRIPFPTSQDNGLQNAVAADRYLIKVALYVLRESAV
jgi:hypothetical protein